MGKVKKSGEVKRTESAVKTVRSRPPGRSRRGTGMYGGPLYGEPLYGAVQAHGEESAEPRCFAGAAGGMGDRGSFGDEGDGPRGFADMADDAALEAYILASGYDGDGRFAGGDGCAFAASEGEPLAEAAGGADGSGSSGSAGAGQAAAGKSAGGQAGDGTAPEQGEQLFYDEEGTVTEIDYIRPAIDDIITTIGQVPTAARNFLSEMGYSKAYQIKLYDVFRDTVEATVRRNPYGIMDVFPRMDFNLADKVGRKLGFEHNCAERIDAYIFKLLQSSLSGGDLFMPKDELIAKACKGIAVKPGEVEDALARLTMAGERVQVCRVDGREAVYELNIWKSENFVAKKLAEICSSGMTGSYAWEDLGANLDFYIREMEEKEGKNLCDEQVRAVKNCLIYDVGGVSVITGGPGTGKTTIIKTIISIMEKKAMKVGLCAPTGKAAKRAGQASGHTACTVHRLLEYGFSEVGKRMIFKKNAGNPLDYDCVIVDEASMIDLALIDALCKAMKPGGRLVLVGDVDQLPSVGAGNVLSDIIKSDYFVTSKLQEIHRQEAGSSIVENAHRINHGDRPFYDDEFGMVSVGSKEEVLEKMIEISKNFDFEVVQILTPAKSDEVLGSPNLNGCLQAALNPEASHKDEMEDNKRIFRVGDKVMQIKNNYQLEYNYIDGSEMSEGRGVFNGETGIVMAVDKGRRTVTVLYEDEKFVEYPDTLLEEIEHSYAITVHKSQGGEYPVVIIPVWRFSWPLMVRNLIYTAVTRAKQKVILVGQEKYLLDMVRNTKVKERNSGLCERIQKLIIPMG